MIEKINTMRVIEKERERFVYLVSSKRDPNLCHTVDMTQNKGLGVCTCSHYLFTVSGNQRRAMAANRLPQEVEFDPRLKKQREGVTQCRHIWGAQRQFQRKHIRPFLSEFANHGQPKDWKRALRKFLTWRGES